MAESDSKPYGVIYCVSNTLTGKRYVGQTTSTLSARWKGRCNGKKGIGILVDAIKKYGREAFVMSQIDVAYSRQELDEKEIYHIARLRTLKAHGGYNIKEGGGGTPKPRGAALAAAEKLRGRKIPRESVEKMAATKRGRARTEAEQAVLDRMANINRGRKHSEESRKKMSEAVTGRKMQPITEEHRKKLSDAAKAQWQSGRGHSYPAKQ
jgi:group I intron endonuclease